MLECIDDKIDIHICGERLPDVEYINSLPGITLESIDAPTEQDQKTYRGAWDDIISEAKKRFNLSIRTKLNECREHNKHCDYDALFCEVGNADLLVLPWKYMVAIVLLEYRIYSTRINRYTLFDRDKAIELIKHYRQLYEDSVKESMLMLNIDSCCLDCAGNPQFVTWLP